MPRARSWTDEQLVEAIGAATSWNGVSRSLGLAAGGGTYAVLRGHAARIGVDSGGMHRYISAQVRSLGLDTSHFLGRGWAKGKPGRNTFARRPIETVLVVGSSVGGSWLLRRLVDEGLKDRRCEHCERTEWRGEPIPLELDHVSGDARDNRLENLRLLCPNCHALTPTYCGRNRGRVVERHTRRL